jgi:hypothetical protein
LKARATLTGLRNGSRSFPKAGSLVFAGSRAAADESGVAGIHARSTYRMHHLSEFMKTLLQCFTRWFNRTHQRSGTLWKERYKSVIVESGIAARTMGNGRKSREGLVRACLGHPGAGGEAEQWKEVSRIYRRTMGLAHGGCGEVERPRREPSGA